MKPSATLLACFALALALPLSAQEPAMHEIPLINPDEAAEALGQDKLEEGTALCLSGGGYRAMLFHLGVLIRLNELGALKDIKRISSVSGGSITAAALGMNWDQLAFGADGAASNFDALVTRPVRRLASKTIDRKSVLQGKLLPFMGVGDRVTAYYRKYLFGKATLQDLPDEPRFVINATSLKSGVLCRFSKPYTWDYRIGKIPNPELRLATAVAASSAFPPVLSPVVIKYKVSDFEANTGTDLQTEAFMKEAVLTDGGVYDNLGIESIWKRYETILVSDAGGKYEADPNPSKLWSGQTLRVLGTIDNQVRSLRKRQIMAGYQLKQRTGAFWDTRANIEEFDCPGTLPCPFEQTQALAQISTRLKALPALDQERLINWGYAVCDAAMRSHVEAYRQATPPAGFPYPGAGVGE